MAHAFTASYCDDVRSLYRMYKRQAEKAMAQVPDDRLATPLDAETDSIAQVVKHLSGNMRSRWTDFLTSDGEKADRDRDGEFVDPPNTREQLVSVWEAGWTPLVAAINALNDDDLERTITIRGEAHSVMQAMNRNLTHTAYHCGQIVLMAKYFTGDQWKSFTIPRAR